MNRFMANFSKTALRNTTPILFVLLFTPVPLITLMQP